MKRWEKKVFYDIDHRYRLALQPDALVTTETCVRAINSAMEDVKLAGLQAETDPAIALLSRRLGRIAEGKPLEHEDDQNLRDACMKRLSELKSQPAIIGIVLKGIDHDPVALRNYRREGQRTLRQLAIALGYDRDKYRLDYLTPSPGLAGDHELTARGIHVRLNPGRWGESPISWRHPKWKAPGNKVRKADITVLRNIDKLARTIARELALEPARQGSLI